MLAAAMRSRGDVAADDGDGQLRCFMGNLSHGLFGARDEDRLFQQVGRRIAANGQFGKNHQLRSSINSAASKVKNFADVTVKVPNRRVDLGKRDLHVDSVSEASG